jgi:hypothetical protein
MVRTQGYEFEYTVMSHITGSIKKILSPEVWVVWKRAE